MRQIVEEHRLPSDIDAQPLVQAAAALRSVVRGYRNEIEREQQLPKALVEQFHAAGFYSMVIPRALGGLQADPLTYLRVVEVLAEAAGSVGWNLANNGIGQLVTLGLPDDGVHEIYAHGADTVIAGTAVMGGGRAVPVDRGYRTNRSEAERPEVAEPGGGAACPAQHDPAQRRERHGSEPGALPEQQGQRD